MPRVVLKEIRSNCSVVKKNLLEAHSDGSVQMGDKLKETPDK